MGEYARVYRSDLTDRQLMTFWAMVQAAGRDRAVTYCMEPQDGPGFVRWMRQPDIMPWIILFRGAPCGLFFLTDKEGKTAQAHFCTLPMGTQRTAGTPIGRLPAVRGFGLFCAGAALWECNVSGGSILDTLIGVTPACNREAVRFAQSLGALEYGIVPGICWYHDTNENVPGLITAYTRQVIPEWAASL